ncbi:LLM class flavin-dependent oxidoreductase [Streptomyces sp. SID10853]|uniref:LLM class flavin-dependent oxidoreductase n=1 Tax=Streptomyces sp. SID10853 TaxID=2706028 RepID=UPI001EF318F3|nr:LLM class flavin-dependent oxidoreductase [Streptomyces sp. SID10853]
MARVFPEGQLVYGMQLPIQSQSTIYAEAWEAAATPYDLAEIARTADRTGFAYIAGCDHVAIPRRLAEAMGTVWYDPVATLGFLAGVTQRVRLMSHVAVLGLRHPLLTAKQYATLDHLSGGRLILGVGAGHVPEEFEAVGADFPGRGSVLNESIDALRAALGPAEYPEHHGALYDFDGLAQLLLPHVEAGRIRPLPLPVLVQLLLGPMITHILTRPAIEPIRSLDLPPVNELCELFAEAYVRAVGQPE